MPLVARAVGSALETHDASGAQKKAPARTGQKTSGMRLVVEPSGSSLINVQIPDRLRRSAAEKEKLAISLWEEARRLRDEAAVIEKRLESAE
jgi:hypothetical protein